MADLNTFTEESTQGFGQRILNSIIGIPIGLLLIVAGIGILYWNEGRFDLSTLAKTATEIQADQQAPASAQGKLVAVNGDVSSNEQLGDVFLKAGNYLALKRTTEAYAWVEESHSESSGNTGGSETTRTTYTYKQQWVESVPDSSTFKHPQGHTNTEKSVQSETMRVKQASMGNYSLDIQTVGLPAYTALNLTTENAVPTQGFALGSDSKLYKGANQASPQTGDMRISYSAIEHGFNGTVLGKLSGTNVGTFVDEKNHGLHRLFSGNKEDAVATLHNEYKTQLWLFRGGGFVAIFIGLTMLLGPLTTFLSFFPTLGRIGSSVIATVAFPVALLLGGVSILVGKIAHNPVALIVSVLLIIVASAYFIRRRGKKIESKQVSSPAPMTQPNQVQQQVQQSHTPTPIYPPIYPSNPQPQNPVLQQQPTPQAPRPPYDNSQPDK